MDNYQSIASFLFVNLLAGGGDVTVVDGQLRDTDEEGSVYLVYATPAAPTSEDGRSFVYVVKADSVVTAFRSVASDAPEESTISVYAGCFAAAAKDSLVAAVEQIIPQMAERARQLFLGDYSTTDEGPVH